MRSRRVEPSSRILIRTRAVVVVDGDAVIAPSALSLLQTPQRREQSRRRALGDIQGADDDGAGERILDASFGAKLF
jgi:hypothetical protein